MGTLFIESENGKKYGYLKMFLINSMTQEHNRYPTSKADAYTMLFEYAPKRLKSNNNLMATRNRPATCVSFYQRDTPVDGPPVAGTNGIIEEMSNCWKYGHSGYRSLLCTNSNTKGFQGMQFMFTQDMQPLFTEKPLVLRD